MTVPLTAMYAAMAAVLIILLAMRVAWCRRSLGVGLGDGGDPRLTRYIRVHANTVESVPLALLLMLIFEINRGADWLINLFGVSLIVARVLYIWGLERSAGGSFGRFVGTLLTWLVILALAGLNLLIVV